MADIAGIEIVSKEKQIFRIRFKGKKRKPIDLYYKYTADAHREGCDSFCAYRDICKSGDLVNLVGEDLETFCNYDLLSELEILCILDKFGKVSLEGFYIMKKEDRT